MAGNLTRRATHNQVLCGLSAADFELLEPNLETVDLPLRRRLESRNRRVEHVYFLEEGIASIVANGAGGMSIEVGVIGREGMTGSTALLGSNDRVQNETYIQMRGHGQRIKVEALLAAMARSPTLGRSALQAVNMQLSQTVRTALANGRSKIHERLARWLLMAHDRTDGDELHLTHEFLAIMLGVRRCGVTTALQTLVRKGLVECTRGVITIKDRKALKVASNGAYATIYVG